jgi:hypothetical protein
VSQLERLDEPLSDVATPRRDARAARAALLVVVVAAAVPSVRGARLDADLTVGRLDDVRVLRLLGLAENDQPVRRTIAPNEVM